MKHKKTIECAFSTPLASLAQNLAWDSMARAVNAVNSGLTICGHEEIKTKWAALKCDTKQKYVSLKKSRRLTGGGPSDVEELCDWEQKVVCYIGNNLLEGVEKGVDFGILL